MPEWLKGTDCKSVGYAYTGSKPVLSTNFPCTTAKRQRSLGWRPCAYREAGRAILDPSYVDCRDLACGLRLLWFGHLGRFGVQTLQDDIRDDFVLTVEMVSTWTLNAS